MQKPLEIQGFSGDFKDCCCPWIAHYEAAALTAELRRRSQQA